MLFHPQMLVAVFCMLATTLCICSQAPEAKAAARIQRIVTVDPTGSANYTTVQEAVNSIPNNNRQWIKIHLAAGIYREKVYIRNSKSNIFVEGEGADKTSIEWGDYRNDSACDNIPTCATFTSYAKNFVARGIAFKNTYAGKEHNLSRAVATFVAGDKSSFYECSFYGIQDTLYDFKGRHYYKGCYIEGAIDFIFGAATSIYEECTISTVDHERGVPGYITANGRSASNNTSGFVFKNCTITGSHETYLGRAWRPYARVIFYRTFMSNIITPQGWLAWHAAGRENDTTFVESWCSGPGSNISQRVQWEKKLNDDQLTPFINISFIDQEGWLNLQPYP